MMIGAQRSGVTVALHVLEGTGMIRSKRGRVIILDREKLEELAGDSYGPAEAEYRRLIGSFGASSTGGQDRIEHRLTRSVQQESGGDTPTGARLTRDRTG